MPQKLEEKEICKSCGKLFVIYNISRHQHFHAKNCSHCAHSFPNKLICRNTLLLYMHRVWLSRKIFVVEAVPYRSLRIMNYFNTNETVTNVQFLAPTRKLTSLTLGSLSVFIVNFKRSDTFRKTRFLDIPEKNHNFKIIEINHEIIIEKLDYVFNELPFQFRSNQYFVWICAADNYRIFLISMVHSDDSNLNFIN